MAFEVRDWWLAELGMFLSRSALFLLSSLGRGGGGGVMCGWIRADHVLRYLAREKQNRPHFPFFELLPSLPASECPGGRMADGGWGPRRRGCHRIQQSSSRAGRESESYQSAFSAHRIFSSFHSCPLSPSTSLCACVRLCRCVLGSSV